MLHIISGQFNVKDIDRGILFMLLASLSFALWVGCKGCKYAPTRWWDYIFRNIFGV